METTVNRSMSLPMDLLQQFINPVFVETGTFDGRTVQQALDAGFRDVRSVEYNRELYSESMARFISNGRVKLWHGDSVDMLPYMLNDLRAPVTFWLDAHAQGPDTGQPHECPLIEELKIISRHQLKNHVIMIDDRRLMGCGFWSNVCESDVVWHMRYINPRYKIEYRDSLVARGDIIVAHL